MNYLEIIAIALQILLGKSGSFTTYLGGVRQTVTITEVGAATPIGKLSWEAIVVLAVGIATGTGGSFEVRVGADDYQVTVAPVPA